MSSGPEAQRDNTLPRVDQVACVSLVVPGAASGLTRAPPASDPCRTRVGGSRPASLTWGRVARARPRWVPRGGGAAGRQRPRPKPVGGASPCAAPPSAPPTHVGARRRARTRSARRARARARRASPSRGAATVSVAFLTCSPRSRAVLWPCRPRTSVRRE